MAAHFFDIDGTLVKYHTNEWIEGAKEHLIELYKQGHNIILITMRGHQDDGQVWSMENTRLTIMNDLDAAGVEYVIIFGLQSPRIIHDDGQVTLDKRTTNQIYGGRL